MSDDQIEENTTEISTEISRSHCVSPIEPYVRKSKSGNRKLESRKHRQKELLSENEAQEQRLRINSRERKRMHDLNSSLDELRSVMPHAANGPQVRKLSKISTLHHARDYIQHLHKEREILRQMLGDRCPPRMTFQPPPPPPSESSNSPKISVEDWKFLPPPPAPAPTTAMPPFWMHSLAAGFGFPFFPPPAPNRFGATFGAAFGGSTILPLLSPESRSNSTGRN